MSRRCEDRYPVREISMTYRCNRDAGHAGVHGPGPGEPPPPADDEARKVAEEIATRTASVCLCRHANATKVIAGVAEGVLNDWAKRVREPLGEMAGAWQTKAVAMDAARLKAEAEVARLNAELVGWKKQEQIAREWRTKYRDEADSLRVQISEAQADKDMAESAMLAAQKDAQAKDHALSEAQAELQHETALRKQEWADLTAMIAARDEYVSEAQQRVEAQRQALMDANATLQEAMLRLEKACRQDAPHDHAALRIVRATVGKIDAALGWLAARPEAPTPEVKR